MQYTSNNLVYNTTNFCPFQVIVKGPILRLSVLFIILCTISVSGSGIWMIWGESWKNGKINDRIGAFF